MERINEIRNKKQQFIANKASKLLSFTSILKLTIALALFFIAAFMISGAGITAENGALNVSNNLLVDTNTLFVDSANNRVGIGTTSPGTALTVKTANDVNQALFSRDGTNGIFVMGNQISASRNWQVSANFITADTLQFTPSTADGGTTFSTPALTIQEGGNVGIGTTGPTSPLVVKSSSGTNSQIRFSQDADPSTNYVGLRRDAAGDFQLSHSGTDRFTVQFGGNVGIGDISPDYLLEVSGDLHVLEGAAELKVDHSAGSILTYSGLGLSLGTANTILTGPGGASIYMNSGNVGIGTTSPDQKLKVSGNANITGTVYYGALQANSPVLERTAEPFVAKCTIADDGKLVVEYIHNEAGVYSRVIEAVNSDSSNWWHRSCFEKNERFKYLDSLNNQSITIDDIGFDWTTKTAFKK